LFYVFPLLEAIMVASVLYSNHEGKKHAKKTSQNCLAMVGYHLGHAVGDASTIYYKASRGWLTR